MAKFRLSRLELYERIWSAPTSRLAKEFGISDVGLGKICKKYAIPKPPNGYWMKVAHGHPADRIPLPPVPDNLGEIIEIESTDHGQAEARQDKYSEVIAEFGSFKNENVLLEIITSLSKLHPLLNESLKYFNSIKPDVYSRLTPGRAPCVDISVSTQSLERALRLMHTLFRFLELQGYSIRVQERYGMNTLVNVRGVDIQIGILENVTRTPVKSSKDPKSFGHFENKYDYQPTGVLSLRLKNCYVQGVRKEWNDTEKQKLESDILGIAESILAAAIGIRISELERKEEDQRFKEREILEKKEQERIQEEKARRQKLFQDAENWRISQNLRAYIEAMKVMHGQGSGGVNSSDEFGKWIKWATQVADDMDPLH